MNLPTIACMDRHAMIDRGMREEYGTRYAGTRSGQWQLEQELLVSHMDRFVPLLKLTQERLAALIMVPEDAIVPLYEMGRSEVTAIALLGHDDGDPCRWAQAERLVRWAQAIVIQDHRAASYESLARPLGLYGRVLIIETAPEQMPAWEELLQQTNTNRNRIHLAAPVQA